MLRSSLQYLTPAESPSIDPCTQRILVTNLVRDAEVRALKLTLISHIVPIEMHQEHFFVNN